jgi:hypothetical protein
MNNKLEAYVGTVINGKTILRFSCYDKHGQGLYEYKCGCGAINITYIYSIKATSTCKKCRKTRVSNLTDIEAGLGRLFTNYRDSSVTRKLDFKLTLSEFKQITSSPCYYCYSEPSNLCKAQGRVSGYLYSGIDRVDNAKGYTIDNVVPCCVKCNKAKLNMSVKEFREHIIKIYKHWINL